MTDRTIIETLNDHDKRITALEAKMNDVLPNLTPGTVAADKPAPRLFMACIFDGPAPGGKAWLDVLSAQTICGLYIRAATVKELATLAIADKPAPVCRKCNDTHVPHGEDSSVMCTSCPAPCQKCRAGGSGPYCEHTPCNCDCHKKADQPAGDDAAVDAILWIEYGSNHADRRVPLRAVNPLAGRAGAEAIVSAVKRGEVPGIMMGDQRSYGTILAEVDKAYRAICAPDPTDPDSCDPHYIGDAVQYYIADLRAKLAAAENAVQTMSNACTQNSEQITKVCAERDRLAERVAELERAVKDLEEKKTLFCNQSIQFSDAEFKARCELDKALADLANLRIRCEEAIANNQDLRRALAAMTERAEVSEYSVENTWRVLRASGATATCLWDAANEVACGESIKVEQWKERAEAERDALKARKVTLPPFVGGVGGHADGCRAMRNAAIKAIRAAGVEVE